MSSNIASTANANSNGDLTLEQKLSNPTTDYRSTPEYKKLVLNWNQSLSIIKDNINISQYKTWFVPLKPVKWEEELVTIQAPSQFFVDYLEQQYYDLVKKTISRVFGDSTKFEYEIRINSNPNSGIPDEAVRVPALSSEPFGSQGTLKFEARGAYHPQLKNRDTGLNPVYTFDKYITGESNQLAFSAAMAVAENPGRTRYNPIFVYGDTGLGKTHLLHAVGNHIVESKPNTNVLYTNSEKFTMEYVSAIKNNKVSEFVDQYRKVDVLIIDDIQFLEGKEKTQDNFFHTFNALHQAGKQIILTADRTPSELKGIDDRLISRFQWGLTVDIQKPSYETRMAIIQKKSAAEGIEFPQDVVEYIAKKVTTSIRELEGCLISILAHTTFDNRPLDLDLAREVVEPVTSKKDEKILNVDSIKKVVADYYNMDVSVVESKSRKQEIALTRQMSMYLIKKLTKISLKRIGAAFGGRDHSTVLHSCQAIDNYIVTDKTVRASYEHLLAKLQREYEA
jgi:chromosomal replication initiator protein